jgi:dienelactone hydrolase
MSRFIICAAAALFIASQAIAQGKVSFPSTDGDLKGGTPTTITGYLYKPAGSGPFAAVVGLHGCGGFNPISHPLFDQWSKIIPGKGYLLLLIDSLKPRGRDTLCGNSSIEPLKEVARDAVGGLNYLRSRPDVRPDSIALMGWSYGGSVTMNTMSKGVLPDDRGLPKTPERDFRTAIVFYPGCHFLLNAQWRPRQPMLLLIGESDNVVRPAACKELAYVAGPPIDAHFYPNAHHLFDHPNLPISASPLGTIGSNPEARTDAIERVTQFLAKQLSQ